MEPRPEEFDKEETYKERANGLGVKSREENVGWSKALKNELLSAFSNWPAEGHSDSAAEHIEVSMHSDRDSKLMAEILDENGVVGPVPGTEEKHCKKCGYVFVEQLMWCPECRNQRPAKSFKVGHNHTSLHPGDVLEQSSDCPNGYSLERLQNMDRPKEHLIFYPSLIVKDVSLLKGGRTGYADVHEYFRGWEKGNQNLEFVPKGHIKSLYDLAKWITDERKLLQQPKPPPRRVRRLSARRDPVEAISRGCQ